MCPPATTHALLPTLQVEDFRGSPLQLSWWLAANLPVDDTARQQMLGTESVAERLHLELAALRSLTTLRCETCSTEVQLRQGVDGIRCKRLAFAPESGRIEQPYCALLQDLQHRVFPVGIQVK